MTLEPSSGGENFDGVVAPEPLLPVLRGDLPGAGGNIIVHPPPSLVGSDGIEINIPPVFSVNSMRANSPIDGLCFVTKLKRPNRIPGSSVSGILLAIPESIWKKFAANGGWAEHVPLTCLTDVSH
ncbi:hypothetical protein K439DRAFT_1549595 [Ramaria rubella]|nr:hypothetical protein K439DRAFT_1549595 [Ramaria rubella]